MSRGNAAINTRLGTTGRRASARTEVGAPRATPASEGFDTFEIIARALGSVLARSGVTGRVRTAPDQSCHAGARLQPLVVARLRAKARRRPLAAAGPNAAPWFRGPGAVAATLLLGLVALAGYSRIDAPAAAGPAIGVPPALEGAAFAVAEEAAPAPESAATAASGAAPPAAAAPETPEVVVVSLRLVEPEPIPVTLGELYQALARSPWPRELWPQVVRIAQCEAHWGGGVDAAAEGDSGRALGLLQIRVDAHRELARQFNLLTVDGALGAAWVVFQRSGGSFSPWSCA